MLDAKRACLGREAIAEHLGVTDHPLVGSAQYSRYVCQVYVLLVGVQMEVLSLKGEAEGLGWVYDFSTDLAEVTVQVCLRKHQNLWLLNSVDVHLLNLTRGVITPKGLVREHVLMQGRGLRAWILILDHSDVLGVRACHAVEVRGLVAHLRRRVHLMMHV